MSWRHPGPQSMPWGNGFHSSVVWLVEQESVVSEPVSLALVVPVLVSLVLVVSLDVSLQPPSHFLSEELEQLLQAGAMSVIAARKIQLHDEIRMIASPVKRHTAIIEEETNRGEPAYRVMPHASSVPAVPVTLSVMCSS
ncbi:MAG: hypothetical protein PHU25_20080 [Deltaproteobacteria bacterium]|nr:hypothetical protein [Deltaproteobacteria bacterium]